MPALQIRYEQRASLPRLSWLAEVRPNAVRVVHGPWIETRPDGFVEGVWDGDFSQFDFDRNANFFGSGGRLRDGRIVFATATHQIDRLYALESPGRMLVSNSLAFLLAEAADGPDLHHANYFFDLLRHHREGVSQGGCTLGTAQGNQVRLFACCNVAVDDQLQWVTTEKDPGPEPSDYATYRGIVQRAVDNCLSNAADSLRTRTYSPIAAISLGYDSVATAALAKQAGCTRALSYLTSNSGKDGLIDDHGGPVAAALCMEMRTLMREDWHDAPLTVQAEFYLSPAAQGDTGLCAAENLLEGSILVTGRRGETAWGRARRSREPKLRGTFDQLLPGIESIEQRLRVGYIQMHPAYVCALHAEAMYQINNSEEMEPWMLGRGYDRPTARRIAEEAGTPREVFGRAKSGGSGGSPRLSPEARREFESFFADQAPRRIQRRLHAKNEARHQRFFSYLVRLRLRFAGRPLHEWLLDLLQVDRLHKLWKMRDLYIFHWGLLRTMERYKS